MSDGAARTLVTTVLASAVTACVVALSVARPADDTTPPARTEAAPAAAPATAPRPDHGDLAALRDEIAALRSRLAALEAVHGTGERAPADGYVTRSQLDAALAARPAAGPAATTAAAPGGTVTPEFQQQVAAALKAIDAEQIAKKQAVLASQLEERVAALTKTLRLSAHQSAELRAILTARDEDDRALLGMWKEGADPALVGERKVAMAQRFDGELARVLSPAQLATYRDLETGGKKNAAPTKK